MRISTILAASTALAVLTGSTAWAADDNESYVDQNGSGNSASISQSGSDNDAGASSLRIRQENFRNLLTIVQSGDGNDAGTEPGGVVQTSNRSGVDGNQMSVEQLSDGNVVGAASQVSTGTNTNLQRNILNIRQGDAGDLLGSGGNRISSVVQWRQSSRGNEANLTQSGSQNVIALVSQYSPSAGGGNNRNVMTVLMSGDDNGGGALTGAAALAGATASSLIQGDVGTRASRSFIDLTISGDTNQYGIAQYGDQNSVGSVLISGSGNQLGIAQSGNRNGLALSTIAGTGNTIGLDQDGDDNVATLNVGGNSNGGGTLAGAAGTLAAANGLVSGLVKQDGLNNQATLSITTSDNNQFAFLQDGNGNVVDGSIGGVGSNSATVVQIGDTNTSIFTQTGSSNIVAISQ